MKRHQVYGLKPLKGSFLGPKIFNCFWRCILLCGTHQNLQLCWWQYYFSFPQNIDSLNKPIMLQIFHIELSRKAAMQLNVRMSKFLNTEKKLIYKSIIRSNFIVLLLGIFVLRPTQKKLQNLQHSALRITFNDFTSSHNDLLLRANMPTPHLSRLRYIALLKLLNDCVKCLLHISMILLILKPVLIISGM